MNKHYISKSKTKMLKSKGTYPNGANSPTTITNYEFFCGKGKIVEENVRGFNYHFAEIRCKVCNKKYLESLDFSGDDWIVYEKE